jgi:hypothetical protein
MHKTPMEGSTIKVVLVKSGFLVVFTKLSSDGGTLAARGGAHLEGASPHSHSNQARKVGDWEKVWEKGIKWGWRDLSLKKIRGIQNKFKGVFKKS